MKFSQSNRQLITTPYNSLRSYSNKKSISTSKLPKLRMFSKSKHLQTDTASHYESLTQSTEFEKYKSQANIYFNKDKKEKPTTKKLVKSSKKIISKKQNLSIKNDENIELEITSFGNIKSPRKVNQKNNWKKLAQRVQMNRETNLQEWSLQQELITTQYIIKSQKLNNQSIKIQLHKLALQNGN